MTVSEIAPGNSADALPAPEYQVPAGRSIQAALLALTLTNTLRLTFDRFGPGNVSVKVVRALFDSVSLLPLAHGTRSRAITKGKVRGVWLTHRRASENRGVLLYLHGGGFVFGSPRSHKHLVAKLSEITGMPAFLLDYQRAPERPFPTAADQALRAYKWLLKQGYAPEEIVVAGDSAGGFLTAGLLSDLARKRLPMPRAAVLFSPFLDLQCTELDARDAACRDPFVPPMRARDCALAYAGEHGLDHPRLDVLSGSKGGWPPVLIQVGAGECLAGDAERLAHRMIADGAHCELQAWPGQVHVFPAFFPLIPEGREALRYVGEFIGATATETVAESA